MLIVHHLVLLSFEIFTLSTGRDRVTYALDTFDDIIILIPV